MDDARCAAALARVTQELGRPRIDLPVRRRALPACLHAGERRAVNDEVDAGERRRRQRRRQVVPDRIARLGVVDAVREIERVNGVAFVLETPCQRAADEAAGPRDENPACCPVHDRGRIVGLLIGLRSCAPS